MLCANNSKKQKCIAWETRKSEGPFYCPECKEEVLLRKGNVRVHHFSHKPPVSCVYGTGESEEHYQIKKYLLEYLQTKRNCSKCDIERSLDGVRPDLSLYINNKPVAIEIQKSTIQIDEIVRRQKRYTELGIALLWIIPGGFPNSIYHERSGQLVHKMKEWELFLHAMYYGRLYYWSNKNKIVPVHFRKLTLTKKSAEWYEPGGELVGVDGYTYKAKRLRAIIPMGKQLLIENDFVEKNRDVFSNGKWKIPNCKIYIDRNLNWW